MKRAVRRGLGLGILLVWIASVIPAFAQADYRVKPGDTLSIEVLEDAGLNRSVLVTPDGRISLPLAGTVTAGGRTIGQIERALSSALAPNFATRPNVFVAVTGIPIEEEQMDEDDLIIVYVVGEVNEPGPKEVFPNTTVLQLLSQSGGFTAFAATKRLQLRRTDPHSGRERLFTINYRALSRGARLNTQPTLVEGDVLLVPERRIFE